jgi:uncharacterized repeat protein (TIGR01451 family)
MVPASSTSGTTVTYPPAVGADRCVPVIENICKPASGSSFLVGSTEVICAATFSTGVAPATCKFVVKVLATDLSITSNVPPAVPSGHPVTFSLTVRNNGPTETPGVIVNAPLPSGFSATGFAPSPAATCSGTTTVTCHFVDSLASGATATIAITADGSPGPGILTSTVTVNGTASDFNQTNNASVVSLQVFTPTPVLGVGALIVLAACMAAIALLKTR